MLAMKNKEHIVEGSAGGLATMARVSLAECQKAITKLESPDPDDSSGVGDGRRIHKLQGGWLVVNGAAYQDTKNSEERKAYMSAYMRQYRRKQLRKRSVNNGKQPLASVSLLDIDRDRD